MNNIKKAGIITGAVVGGVIGGTISVIGKVTKKKFIDELGESVVDSTILTGGIAGDIASGTANVISGKIQHQQDKLEEGKTELKSAGSQVVQNFVNNVKTVVDNSGEILEGVKEKDGKKILRGTRTLAKVVVVGALTVGTIKIKPEDESDEASKADAVSKVNEASKADALSKVNEASKADDVSKAKDSSKADEFGNPKDKDCSEEDSTL